MSTKRRTRRTVPATNRPAPNSSINKLWSFEIRKWVGTFLYYVDSYICGLFLWVKASVVQLVRTSDIMRVVMGSSPGRCENCLIFYITYDSCLVIIEVWLSGSEPNIIRWSTFHLEAAVNTNICLNFSCCHLLEPNSTINCPKVIAFFLKNTTPCLIFWINDD